MNRINGLMTICLLILIAGGAALAHGQALNGPSILVVSAEGDPATAEGQAGEAARHAFITRLRRAGMQVAGRTAAASVLNKESAKWAHAARRAPVDALVLFSSDVARRKGAYTDHFGVRLQSRILGVSRPRAAKWIETRRERRLPATCKEACAAQWAVRLARQASAVLAARAARRILGLGLPPVRILKFQGFAVREARVLLPYLRAFPGHNLLSGPIGGAGKKETIIRYHSSLRPESLRAALHKMLRLTDYRARIESRGRVVTVLRGGTVTAGRQW